MLDSRLHIGKLESMALQRLLIDLQQITKLGSELADVFGITVESILNVADQVEERIALHTKRRKLTPVEMNDSDVSNPSKYFCGFHHLHPGRKRT
jgi:hypothetical protein